MVYCCSQQTPIILSIRTFHDADWASGSGPKSYWFTVTLILFSDNLVVSLSHNLVLHSHSKHKELDLVFVRFWLTLNHICCAIVVILTQLHHLCIWFGFPSDLKNPSSLDSCFFSLSYSAFHANDFCLNLICHWYLLQLIFCFLILKLDRNIVIKFCWNCLSTIYSKVHHVTF